MKNFKNFRKNLNITKNEKSEKVNMTDISQDKS